MPWRLLWLGCVSLGFAGPAFGHYHMFFPEKTSAGRGEPVTVYYQWGHPFEHELFDAEPPAKLLVLTPDGRQTQLSIRAGKVLVPNGANVSATAYQFSYTPEVRGDHVLIAVAAPVWMQEEREFLEDTARVVLHVQAQTGWDNALSTGLEVVPLTRPYGLGPGTSFQAEVRLDGKPLPGALVEVELYQPARPQRLPPDEHVTRTAKTSAAGSAVLTLGEPGWWGITAVRDAGRRRHGDDSYPVRQRSTLWVQVDGALPFRDNPAASAP